jgi:coenzyme F420-0:L-glutamate ligase/coenzyme F420-1:gamma-L-glutamate ligase
MTQIATGDELAAAASLIMGQADEGIPAVWVRGLEPRMLEAPSGAGRLVRPLERDLFK